MTRTISSPEFKMNFDSILREIADDRESYMIESNGELAAVLLSPAEYAELRREWAWRVVDKLREQNADQDPDRLYEQVTTLVEEVRQQRYDRANSSQGSS